MANRSVTYEFRAKFDSFRTSLGAGGRAVDDFGNKLMALDAKGRRARRGLTEMGDIGGRTALGAAGGLAAIVGVTANFEKAMSSVQAATRESAEGMDALRDAAIEAGAQTAFSASEAAGGIEALAKAGVTTEEFLAGGLTGALDLAAAGSLEVADAAEAAASAMAQFGLSGEDVPHIADLLAAAAGKAQGEVSDMAAALNQSGIIAAQTGLSIEETTGALASFAEKGLLGSDAGTSFKTMLGALTPNSAKAAEAMEELGISAYDSQGNFVGLTEFAGSLRAGLADLTEEQRAAKLEIIFGSDAVRAASILYENGADGVQGWIDKVDDSGYAAETAATKLDNLAGDFEELKGSVETALIGMGEGSQGPLRELVQGLTDAINAFTGMPAIVQNSVTGILAATAVLGGGLWATSKVVNGIATTKQALHDLGVEAGKTRGILGRVAKAGAGLAVFEAVTFALDELTAQLETPINTNTLSRDLNALADGRVTDNLQDMSIWLGDIQDKWERDWNPIARLSPLDMSGFEDAERGLADLDESLARLVESGDADQAAAAFAEIQEQAEEAGLSGNELIDIFGEYSTALQQAGMEVPNLNWAVQLAADTRSAVAPTEELAEGTDDLADSAERATPKIDNLRDAIKETRGELRDAREAAFDTAGEFFGLGEKVDKAKVSLSEWIADLEKQAEALRTFRENAEEAARKGLDEGLIASLEEAGPTGALRMEQLANASEEEIERVNKAWRNGSREMGKFVDHVTGPLEDALEKMRDQLKRLRDRLAELERQEDIRINVTLAHREIGPHLGAFNIDLERTTSHARGGLISGAGSGTSDSIPAYVSRGEYVVRAAAVEKYGVAMFDRLNAMRFADGGFANRAPASSGASGGVAASIDYDHLAAVMLRARPLYGDVHISGDPTTFKRELAADARRASLGGFS